MKDNKLTRIFLTIGIIGIVAVACLQSIDTKLKINEDIYKMLEYLEIEECVITKLSADADDQADGLTPEARIDVIQSASEFDLSREQIVAYATGMSISATTDYVLYSNLSLDEYLARYRGISASDFFEDCYLQAKYEVEYFLTIGALAEKHGITVSEEDVDIWCSQNDISRETLSEEELCYLHYHVIEEKIRGIV